MTRQWTTVNDDPYGEGWLVAVKPDETTDLDQLMSKDEYLDAVDTGDDDEDLLDEDEDAE